jgi:hypothetical protein
MLDVTDSPAINELLRYLEDNYGEEATEVIEQAFQEDYDLFLSHIIQVINEDNENG